MTRDVLTKVLSRLDGVELDGSEFRVAEERQIHLYLGDLGQAMVARSVRKGVLHDKVLEFTAGEREETLVVEYDAVSAVALGEGGKKGRTGFA